MINNHHIQRGYRVHTVYPNDMTVGAAGGSITSNVAILESTGVRLAFPFSESWNLDPSQPLLVSYVYVAPSGIGVAEKVTLEVTVDDDSTIAGDETLTINGEDYVVDATVTRVGAGTMAVAVTAATVGVRDISTPVVVWGSAHPEITNVTVTTEDVVGVDYVPINLAIRVNYDEPFTSDPSGTTDLDTPIPASQPVSTITSKRAGGGVWILPSLTDRDWRCNVYVDNDGAGPVYLYQVQIAYAPLVSDHLATGNAENSRTSPW